MRTERKLHTFASIALAFFVVGCGGAPAGGEGRPVTSLPRSPLGDATPEPSDSTSEPSQPAAEESVALSDPLLDSAAELEREHTPAYPFHAPLPGPGLEASDSAMKYANLSPGQCIRELARRDLPFKRVGGVSGVANEVRIDGPIRGIRFMAPGGRSPYGVLDCRLALTLDSLAEVLVAHDVAAVRIDNMYRPRAHLPGSRRRSQHAYGLAIDLTVFELSDGRTLEVERDFSGTIGEPVCGPDAKLTEDREEAVLLRNLVCDLAGEGLFHHILTPNYNQAHRDHLHLDIKRDAKRCGIH